MYLVVSVVQMSLFVTKQLSLRVVLIVVKLSNSPKFSQQFFTSLNLRKSAKVLAFKTS